MEIGFNTDGLGFLSFEKMLKTIVSLGIKKLELPLGNWSSSPHADLNELVTSKDKRDEYMGKVKDSGAEIVALNCSGNQLAPGEAGVQHENVVLKTFQLAEYWGIEKIVMMSGLPGGPGDNNPNWITTSWPPITTEILNYQWNNVAIPYWKQAIKKAADHGIRQIALENHGYQLVYNVSSFFRLREAVGDMIGINLDPSHMFWMGGDPIEAARQLGKSIYHVHAKDARLERRKVTVDGVLDTRTIDKFADRSWNYVALGYGHDSLWWKEFFVVLKMSGYDGVISIEQEDLTMPAIAGVEKAVRFLFDVLPESSSGF